MRASSTACAVLPIAPAIITSGRLAQPLAVSAGKLQHRPVEPRLADLELRGVHADGQPAGAGIDVVAGQGALRPAVELPLLVERQGVGRQHGAAAQDGEDIGRQAGP